MWHQADKVRLEWLEVGLSTEPADRSTTEAILAELYARHHRRRPDFLWVDSPRDALPHIQGWPTHAGLMDRGHLISDIAAGLSRLRTELDARTLDPPIDRPAFKREKNKPWPTPPPLEAIRMR